MTRRFGWLCSILLLTTLLFACSEGGTPTRQIDFIPLASIELQSANDQITVGTSNQFTAIGHYGTAPGIQFTRDITADVTWSSANSGVLSVSNNSGTEGLGTAGVAGTTTVTAELDGITASLDFTVNSELITALSITEQNSTMSVGTTLQLHAVGTFPDGSTQDLTNAVTWGSSDPGVASVSNLAPTIGLVSSISESPEGGIQIFASFDGITATTIVTVTSAALDSIKILPVDALVNSGAPTIAQETTLQLKAVGVFSDESEQDLTDQVLWSSDDTEVAGVSNDPGKEGLVSAGAVGTANISASFRNLAASLPVTVSEATITALQLDPAAPSVAVGQRLNLMATGTFSDNNQQDLTRDVVWSQDDPGIAVVSNADGQEGTVRGLAEGTTDIRASFGPVSESVTLNVTAQ